MKKTGQILRAARENKKISLNEVATITRIHVKILQAIEDGDLDKLPAKTFLRGFVQSYAKFLRLNEEELLSCFLEEMGPTNIQPKISEADQELNAEVQTPIHNIKQGQQLTPFHPPQTKTPSAFPVLTVVLGALGIALFVGVIYSIQKTVKKYEQESQVETNLEEVRKVSLEVAAATPTGAPTGAGLQASPSQPVTTTKLTNIALMATPQNKVMLAVASSPKLKPTQVLTVTPRPCPMPSPTPSPTSTPAPSPSPMATPPSPDKTMEIAVPATQEPVVPTQEQKIIIEALDIVTVKYRTEDGKFHQVKLNPEQKIKIEAKQFVKIDIENGGAVSLIHNGVDKGVPGQLGKPLKLRFP